MHPVSSARDKSSANRRVERARENEFKCLADINSNYLQRELLVTCVYTPAAPSIISDMEVENLLLHFA